MKQKSTALITLLLVFVFSIGKSQIIQRDEDQSFPSDYKIIGEAEGDLDKDGIAERVIIYDTDVETEFGTERQIHIFKKKNYNWELWKKSIGAVLPSTHGGMMGDPFERIVIERGCIVIHHFGGSRQKWNYTHRYRFQQGTFQLIGATIVYGSPCDYFETLDYNLSTGTAIYKKESENCDDDSSTEQNETINRKKKNLPQMDGFYPGDNEILFPKLKAAMYY